MTAALIGYTGFVGGNLLRQHAFDARYNSSNIFAIEGQEFDLLVCAGAPAEKWKANREPERDLKTLDELMRHLRSVRARRAVLISTVDVYPVPVGVDEASAIPSNAGEPYGRHRFGLEGFFREQFDALVIRLPALFGPGLKKNVVYDLLHANMVDQIHSGSVFQFYPLVHLWEHTETALARGLRLVNVVTEPTSVAVIAREAFGTSFDNRPPGKTAVRYDVRSVHAEMFGGTNGYLYDAGRVLAELKAFVDEETGQSS